MAGGNGLFHWADYLLFALSLSVGVVVGIVMAIKQKWHKQSSESYLMGNRKLNWFTVSMSVLASLMTARGVVAFTAEFYYSGFIIIWLFGTYFISGLFPAIVIIPKLFRLGFQITSCYEYFDHRFGFPVRLLVSMIYFIGMLFYMSVILYVPSLVLAQVSVLNVYTCIFIGACVCGFYAAFGGMRAVVLVDSIQILIIAIGMLTLTIKGSIDVGGIKVAWERYESGGRANWNDIDPVPWNRYNVWNIMFLWGILMSGMAGADQMITQRYLTIPSLRRSQRSLILALVGAALFLLQNAILSIIIFATLGSDEPLKQRIQKPDQIMPYFLMHNLGDYHGIPGIVVASLFAASLSSLSSGENALVAVFLEDILRPLYKLSKGRELSEKKVNKSSHILGGVIGLSVLVLSMIVPLIADNVLEISLNIQSFILGPFLGLFVVGFFMPWVESWGAFVSLLITVAWAIMMWVGSKKFGNKIRYDMPPLFYKNITVIVPEPTVQPELWDVSYTWYAILDICMVIVTANLVSLVVHLYNKATVKEYSVRKTFPAKHLRYTVDDFLVAMGCRKHVMFEAERYDDDRRQLDKDYHLESGQNQVKNEVIKDGIDNIGLDTKL